MSSVPPGRLAALGGAVMLLAGAVMLWVSADNGRAVAVTSASRTMVAPAEPPAEEASELVLPEPDLSMPEDPVLRAPHAPTKTAEERRFDRLDRNRDGRIQQAEYLAQRKRNFDRLDVNGDGMLSFAEYAASGIRRFAELDRDGNRTLDRAEFAASAPRPRAQTLAARRPDCVCPGEELASAGPGAD